MWFKQCQLFQLMNAIQYTTNHLTEKLSAFEFTPCLPSMIASMGWVPPIDEEEAPLTHMINGCMMLCLQFEEKILPHIVIRQEWLKKIKQIETAENRTLRQKEKYRLKDEIILTLLPRSFSKLTRVYAYIDTQNNWLVLGTANQKRAEQFVSFFKKSLDATLHAFQFKKLSTTLTYWLQSQQYPSLLSIEKSCLLQDPDQKNRTIRCQQQNLFVSGIQSLLKDGCAVKKLAFSWQDRVQFLLSDDFLLTGIVFQDEIKQQAKDMEAETVRQQFNVDFLIMAETFSALFKDLLPMLMESNAESEKTADAVG